MKNYSIVRVGNGYVVQADEKSVLKVGSRRRAAKTVADATELLDSQLDSKCAQNHQAFRDAENECVIPRSYVIRNTASSFRSCLTISGVSPNHRGGTPPPNGRLAIWKDRS